MKTRTKKRNYNIEKLKSYIFDEIVKRIKLNNALSIFVQERSKFEGWLKVELCQILCNKFDVVLPEIDRFDLIIAGKENVAIELKTLNTNYSFKNLGVKSKRRPITKNIDGVIKDINKLKESDYQDKLVIFIAFPLDLECNMNYWKNQIVKIEDHEAIADLFYKEFRFQSEVPGVIYICKVK